MNTTIANLKALSKLSIVNQNEEVNVANRYFKEVKMKARSIEQVVGTLSGGNNKRFRWQNGCLSLRI